MKQGWLAVLLPLSSLAVVAVIMIGLGILFTIVGGTGTIVIGLAILIGVPFLGLLLTKPPDPYRPLIATVKQSSRGKSKKSG